VLVVLLCHVGVFNQLGVEICGFGLVSNSPCFSKQPDYLQLRTEQPERKAQLQSKPVNLRRVNNP
jgi:hypothetical protein